MIGNDYILKEMQQYNDFEQGTPNTYEIGPQTFCYKNYLNKQKIYIMIINISDLKAVDTNV